MKKIFIIIIRSLAWLFTGIIGLLVLIILLLQTPPIKQRIAQIAENQTADFINGKLTIGKLEGNLWSHLHLNEILLTQHNDTIAHIKAIDLHYRLWPILNREVFVESVDIIQPRIKLIQLQDSTWNVAHLLKERNTAASQKDTSSVNEWRIDLQKLKLENGSVQIIRSDTIIPSRINRLNMILGAYYSERQQALTLHHFSFHTIQPNFSLNQLSFDLKYKDQTLTLSDFIIKTTQNQINASVIYAEDLQEISSAALKTSPLIVDEFAFVLPDLKFKAKAKIQLDAKLLNGQLASTINIVAGDQKIDLHLQLSQFSSWLFNPDSVALIYDAKVDFDNIKLDEWTEIAALNSVLNGHLSLDGTGTDPRNLHAELKAVLTNSIIAGYLLENINAVANYQSGNLNTSVQLIGAFGDLYCKANIRNLLDNPIYNGELLTHRLNLAPLLNNDSLPSDINLRLTANGTGFDPKKLKASAKLNLAPSVVMDVPIDTALAHITYANEIIEIDSLNLKNQSIQIGAQGKYNLSGMNDLLAYGTIYSLDAFKKFLPDAVIHTSGDMEAHLTGPTDSLKIQVQLKLNESQYDDFRIENATLDANSILGRSFAIDSKLLARDFKSSFIELDSITLNGRMLNDSLRLQASVINEDLNTELESNLKWGDQITIDLQKWNIAFKEQQWKLLSPSAIQLDSINYRIDHFRLISSGNQSISVNGLISKKGQEDFTLNISEFNIGSLLQSLEMDPGVNGLLNLNLSLSGNAQSPILDGFFQVDSASFTNYDFSKAEGTLYFNDKFLGINSEFALVPNGRVLIDGKVPFNLNLGTMKANPETDSLVDASISIVEIPLALIRSFIQAKEVAGQINGEIAIGGTLNSPQPSGQIRLSDGKISIPEYGIAYRDMQLKSSFERDIISLDTLGIRSSDGTLTGKGEIYFKSDFYKGHIDESTINLKFNKFNPIDHPQINTQLSGDAYLKGHNDTVVFEGNLQIPQSEVYLPTLLNMVGKAYTPEIPQPILIAELEKMQSSQDSTVASIQTIELSDSIQTDYFRNLTGKVKINIPKNFWIKSPNLRLELSGDLELIKHTQFSEIFGEVNVVRGQYELFGRTFVVAEGLITFQGGEEINPIINLTANYTIKSRDTESKTMQLLVEGDATDPTISFTLDGETISEGDALSYIVFGRGMNELNASEQSSVNDASGGSMAGAVAASLLASQLTKFLGKNFNVDYVEVKSQDSFDNASLEVGKYLTNDLFISYEQQIGATTDHDLSRYEVKLEYEILKFLFLQLDNSTNESGFDVIFKVNLN